MILPFIEVRAEKTFREPKQLVQSLPCPGLFQVLYHPEDGAAGPQVGEIGRV